MGQIRTGIIYAARIPEGVDIWGENEDGVLAVWYEELGHRDIYWPEDSHIVGVWVAVDGASNKDAKLGEIELYRVSMSLADIKMSTQFERAKKAWMRFATWAAKRGVVFGDAELWVAPIEVA